MRHAKTSYDPLIKELFDSAGHALDVDTAGLRQTIEARESLTPTRRPHRIQAWHAAPAAAAVVVGFVAVTAWHTGRAQESTNAPAAAGSGASIPAGSGPTSTAAALSTPSATTTAAASGAAGPLQWAAGMPLPENQQFVTRTVPAADYVLEGRTTGLGTVHIDGKTANVVLVPATSVPNEREPGSSRPAACIVILPEHAAIDARDVPQKTTSCTSFPSAADPSPVGAMSFLGLGTNHVDEFRGRAWTVIATSTGVARVEVTLDGETVELPTRVTAPGIAGALFTGLTADGIPVEPDPDNAVTGYDASGKKLFSRPL